jgi:hypothetical protein
MTTFSSSSAKDLAMAAHAGPASGHDRDTIHHESSYHSLAIQLSQRPGTVS